MKTFNREHLPDSVQFDGKTYYYNDNITTAWEKSKTPLKTIQATLKTTGRHGIIVAVLQNTLKGKLDAHNKPYKPREYIFTTNPAQ
jgi:hypothetical protein